MSIIRERELRERGQPKNSLLATPSKMAADDPVNPAKSGEVREEVDADEQVIENAELKKKEEEDAFQKRVEEQVKIIVDATKTAETKAEEESSFAKAAPKVKANTKDKAEMQNFERKMVGDVAKFLCDKCDYTAITNRAVKMHWGKKHRREVQEEEEVKTGGKPSQTAEAKKLKPEVEQTEIKLLDLYDDDGNPLDETAELTTLDYSIMETQQTQEFDTSTPMKSKTEDNKINIKKAEVESLK